MSKDLPLFRRVVRNLRRYCADVRTAVTGKGTLHFAYGDFELDGLEQQLADVNPATGLLMLDKSVDVAGNPYGTRP